MFFVKWCERLVRWCILKPIYGHDYEKERIRTEDFSKKRTRPVL